MRFESSTTRQPSKAFTLIELMVVMAILAILVSLITSVSGYIMRQGREKETVNIMAIVSEAMQAYRDQAGFYPPMRDKSTDPSDVNVEFTGDCLAKHLVGDYPSADDPKPYAAVKAAKDVLARLPKTAGDVIGGSPVLDGFGGTMRYKKDGALGGGPLLISAGPDKKFPSPDDKDNIRSDEAR